MPTLITESTKRSRKPYTHIPRAAARRAIEARHTAGNRPSQRISPLFAKPTAPKAPKSLDTHGIVKSRQAPCATNGQRGFLIFTLQEHSS
jgi:hypothetical protein